MKRFQSSILLAAAVLLASAAHAGTIAFPPSPSTTGNTIAANDSVNGNIWAGVSQSFTAQDPQVTFGFYMFEQSQISTGVLFSLYAGDGVFTSLLSQKAATLLSGTAFSPTLLTVDFSSTSLVVGSKYTVAVTLPSGNLPAAGTYANASVLYAGSSAGGDPNPYAGGTFYYVGSSYNPASFVDRDIAFKVTPVPEPTTSLLLLCGMAVVVGLKRRAIRSEA